MTEKADPLWRLAAVNPVRFEDVAGMASSETAVALYRRITTEPVAVRPAPAPRRRRRLAPVLLVVTLGAGAAAYALATRDVSRPEVVSCFAAVDLEAAFEVVTPGAEGAAASCAELWAAGRFGATAVPALVECVLESGAIGVFPAGGGQDPCRRLNLPPLPASPPTTVAPVLPSVPEAGGSSTLPLDPTARFAIFQEAVVGRFLASSCVDPDQGRAIVREELARAGMADWTVRDAAAFTAGRPCATLGFDSPARQVLLVPGPQR